MYSSQLYDGTTLCDECGGSLVDMRALHNFFGEGKYCENSYCRWIASYRKACLVPGKRPISPAGAWGWTCRITWEEKGPYCGKCGKLIGHYLRGTWYQEGRVDFHHIVPIHCGGNSLPENLVVLCPDCHKEVHKRRGREKAALTQKQMRIDIYLSA